MIRISKAEPADIIRPKVTYAARAEPVVQQTHAIYVSPSATSFDYTTIPVAEADALRATAERVRSRHRQQVAAIIETGRDLAAVKEQLGHGRFGEWIAAEFQMTDRTARNYLSAFEAFGAKTETVSDLNPTTVYKLAAAPQPIRETVLQRRQAEHLPADAVKDALAEEIEADRKAKAEARMTPAALKLARQLERDRKARAERERLKRNAEWDERKRITGAANDRLVAVLIDVAGDRLREVIAAAEGSDFADLGRRLSLP